MKPQQTITEFEAEFRSLVEIVNNPDLVDARISEVEQAKDFTDKLLPAIFGDWKVEVREEEDRQQQRVSCSQVREPIKGYPQTMAEAVNRAKTVERQVLLKRNRNNQQTGRRRDDKKPTMELHNFANTPGNNDDHKRLATKRSWRCRRTPKQVNTGLQNADTVKVSTTIQITSS